jgi:hypothetical protein
MDAGNPWEAVEKVPSAAFGVIPRHSTYRKYASFLGILPALHLARILHEAFHRFATKLRAICGLFWNFLNSLPQPVIQQAARALRPDV